VPFARKPAYNRALAIGFPLLILVLWEIMVHLGYLNGRWFPPPSRITLALWDLIVTYDRFNGTSLLGRPWLIPSALGQDGWEVASPVIAGSHVQATLFRGAAGLVIGALLGILEAIAMRLNRVIREMLDPIMPPIYGLPQIAIFPLMMLIFGDPF